MPLIFRLALEESAVETAQEPISRGTITVVMNFEQLVLARRNNGSEVGDINHSGDFPPRDESNQLLCQQLVDYMMDDKLGFLLPFSVIVDKDESHLRL